MSGGALGGKIFGGGGGGGRVLKSISVPVPPVLALVLGIVVGTLVSSEEGAGAKLVGGADTGVEDCGCVGLGVATLGLGPARGRGIIDPGKTGKELRGGGGATFPTDGIREGEELTGEELELVTSAGN